MVKANKRLIVIWNEEELFVTNSIRVAVDHLGNGLEYKTYYSFLDRAKKAKNPSKVFDNGIMKAQKFNNLEEYRSWTKIQLFEKEQEVIRLERERTALSVREDKVLKAIESQYEVVDD